MTAAVGDALSHVLQQRFSSAIFRRSWRRKSTHRSGTEWTLRRVADHDICSCAECMAVMSYQRERQVSRAISSSRITCSNLVEADNDFARQYFQVINGL